MKAACPRAPRGKKNNNNNKKKTDPHGEDKKEKQHKIRMNIRNVCTGFGLKHNVSLIEYTPQDSKIMGTENK